MGTRLAAYHLRFNTVRVRMRRTYGTSFVQETHMTRSRTIAKNEIAPSTNAAMKGTMIIMALTTTTPTDIVLRLEGVMKWGSSLSLVI
jgi:hypothetical protein